MNITKESILDDLENDRLPIPTLPEVALKVRDTVEDENSTLIDVSKIIETDPALTARIIQVANSALYRTATPAENVHAAVMRLGLNTVRNLSTSLVMKQLFQATNPVVDKYLRNTWKLSTDVAAFSAVLSKAVPGLDSDSALLAGLTHSIGISPILVKAESDPVLLNDIDTLDTLINELHPVVGEAILKSWDFSELIYKVPTECLNLKHETDGNPDYADIVQVALIQTVAGTNHPLGAFDLSHSNSMERLGMSDDFDAIDMEGGVQEVKDVFL
ncbi:MAG: HDOD domain-containing protein [Gammaproteobacteria bacterium]|nr:HDOD domain-containing protein [Gammaproteobacteria bacterium]